MRSLTGLVLGGLFFCCAQSLYAQDWQQDSVVANTVLHSERNESNFDSVGEPLSVLPRTVPQQSVDSLKNEDAFWYANLSPQKKAEPSEEENNNEPFYFKKWFRQLAWIVVLCSFIGVVLWYLSSSNIFIFRGKAKKIAAESDVETASDDIFSLNYNSEIAKAAAAKNFRLAVRLRYLQTLRLLSDKALIDYRYGRTNSHYVSQLSHTAHCRDFSRLTRHFEYTWYGQFEPSAEGYEAMQADFEKFKRALN